MEQTRLVLVEPINLFITQSLRDEGVDIRPLWFEDMPDKFGIRRFAFLDDDRMEWLYNDLEARDYKDMICNWILVCILGNYSGPDIVTLGIPRDIVKRAAEDRTDLRFALSAEKIPQKEFGTIINLPVTKKAVIDPAFKRYVVDVIAEMLQSTITRFKELRDEDKNPAKCNAFSKVWHPDKMHRGHYRTDRYDLVAGDVDTLPDLQGLNDKDLAVLATLYQEDRDAFAKIQREMERRGSQYAVKMRGQHG